MELFVCLEVDAVQRARLERLAGSDPIHFLHADEAGAEPDPRFLRAEVALGAIPPAWVGASSALRWLQLDSTGVDGYAGVARATGVRVSNLAGFYAGPVAESCLAAMLAVYRGIDRLVRLQDRQEWVGFGIRRELRMLTGRTVVLFGHGAINRRLEELLQPFRCTVLPFASDWRPEALDAALAEADIVACAAPGTDGTRDVFDRDRIGRMRPEAVLINFGRGTLVDEAALVAALEAGRIAGAVLDVTRVEPLLPGDRLWSVPNLLLMQHSGGGSTAELADKVDVFAAGLERYRRGETPDRLVDFDRGY